MAKKDNQKARESPKITSHILLMFQIILKNMPFVKLFSINEVHIISASGNVKVFKIVTFNANEYDTRTQKFKK